jgi:hypothetical protein
MQMAYQWAMWERTPIMLLPQARTHKLTVRQLPDETLVYDHLANKAHCLNRTAALVWQSCDGGTTVGELAGRLQAELGIPTAEPVIHLTLEKLARRGLLAGELRAVRQDRRKLLRRLAMAALPVILTMTAPRAAQAASQAAPPAPPAPPACGPGNCTGCCAGNTCVPSGSQTNSQCGLNGVACVACMAPRGFCNRGTGTCTSPP